MARPVDVSRPKLHRGGDDDGPCRTISPALRLGRLSIQHVIGAILLAVGLLTVLDGKEQTFVGFRVASASMEPALHCSGGSGCLGHRPDYVRVERLRVDATSLKRGDIIVFNLPRRTPRTCGRRGPYVKRIVGMPGETIRASGRMAERVVRERHVNTAPSRAVFKEHTIAASSYFVMGDNRRSACDSRVFGPVPYDSIIGKVILIYSPSNRRQRVSE